MSPAISPGENAVMRAAFNEGLPLIYLQENGFTDLAKPAVTNLQSVESTLKLIDEIMG